MSMVRLYVSQNNRHWHEDVPYGQHLERAADIELEGGTVYHASILPKTSTRPTRSRLKQRLY
jgi:hypothetical protein